MESSPFTQAEAGRTHEKAKRAQRMKRMTDLGNNLLLPRTSWPFCLVIGCNAFVLIHASSQIAVVGSISSEATPPDVLVSGGH